MISSKLLAMANSGSEAIEAVAHGDNFLLLSGNTNTNTQYPIIVW